MATIQRDSKKVRACCDVPRCVKKRRDRHQANGRFLFSLEFGENDTVTITLTCPECGGNHTVTIPRAQPNGISDGLSGSVANT